MSMRLRLLARLPLAIFFLAPLRALARIGGGEHYDSGNRGDDGGGDASFIVDLLLWLLIHHPGVGIPLLLIAIVVYVLYQRSRGDASTRRAIDAAEATRKTQTSAGSVAAWVSQLKRSDAAFELLPFFDRTKRLFVELQDAWFKRNLEPVRRYLSDATYQRLLMQLRLIEMQGLRDAIAEPTVLDLQIVGLEQTPTFDTVHIRVRATLRDDDAPATFSDEQAHARAMKRPPEAFTEVWSFVRKPGATTKDDGFQGTCPNCGAPFNGGAANRCEYCQAIVNSGQYDWVVAEITQGVEFADSSSPEGVELARQSDPAFSIEVLEDRASLAFWKWVDAQSSADASRLAKVAAPDYLARVDAELSQLRARNQRRHFLECAVGGVHTRQLSADGDLHVAAIEFKWSARVGVAAVGSKPGAYPSQPQRSVLLLQRSARAQSNAAAGMSTNRCPTCLAPLSDNGQTHCEFCGGPLASGDSDWVIRDFVVWEAWGGRHASRSPRRPARVPDRDERERLLYIMASLAKADGTLDARERKLLEMAAQRWAVPWANVELALSAGPALFEKLIARGSADAETFMRELVAIALVDGLIDARERALLKAAAQHLGLEARLDQFIREHTK